MNEIIKIEDWYKKLLIDLQKLEVGGIIMTKWLQGKRIVKDELKFEKPEYGSKRLENIGRDLKVSTGEVYAWVAFYKKYKDGISDSVRKLSWHFVFHHLLYKERQKLPAKIEPLPKGKYNIIYADPPWNYWGGGFKNQSQHYAPMSIDEIANIKVEELAADNCILFLWATFPILPEAINLISQWGFNYSTVGFVWVKSNRKTKKGFFMGLGNWTRSNAELCLIATKGSIERKNMNISQIIYSPVGEHSKKPDIVREKIIKLVGDLPRIELFARQKTDNWEVWGDQV